MARERIFEPRIGSPRLDDVASFETLDWPGVWSFIPCLRCDAFRDDASERNPQLQFRLQSIFCRQEYDHISLILLVGAGRFERPTPCAQGRCATRLRYAPTLAGCFNFMIWLLNPISEKQKRVVPNQRETHQCNSTPSYRSNVRYQRTPTQIGI